MTNVIQNTYTIRTILKGRTVGRIPEGTEMMEAHAILVKIMYPKGMESFGAVQISEDYSWALSFAAAMVERDENALESHADDAGWILTEHLGSQCEIDYGTEI